MTSFITNMWARCVVSYGIERTNGTRGHGANEDPSKGTTPAPATTSSTIRLRPFTRESFPRKVTLVQRLTETGHPVEGGSIPALNTFEGECRNLLTRDQPDVLCRIAYLYKRYLLCKDHPETDCREEATDLGSAIVGACAVCLMARGLTRVHEEIEKGTFDEAIHEWKP
ncbi:MAG: hypothetical protein OXF02_00855 [Simkaniaceae bacterium]|nr:hypothetical protein [Simkaniaceae bacterium]